MTWLNPFGTAALSTVAAQSSPTALAGGVALVAGAGNWVVPAGVTRIKYTLLGAGGGGSGLGLTAAIGAGSGGGGGEMRIGWADVTPGLAIPYSIGAGGAGGVQDANGAAGAATTFGSVATLGSVITAAGGGGGRINNLGGTGGTGGAGGSLVVPGQTATSGLAASGTNFASRGAGSSHGHGGDAKALNSNGSISGGNAVGYGAGGGGCVGYGLPTAGQTSGGNGSGGLILIEWI